MAAPKGAGRRGCGPTPRPAMTPLVEERSTKRRTSPGRTAKSQPIVGERHRFTCRVCGDGNADATYSTRYGKPQWLIGCKSAKCEALGGGYLKRLAEKIGAPSGSALKDDPRPYLAAMPSARRSVSTGEAPGLPSDGKFGGWAARLLASPDPLAYLTDERGIDRATLERFGIGWDGARLIVPMRSRGKIVAAKTRHPSGRAQMRALPGRGRPWPLYPEPEPDWPWVLLVAGELDALRGRTAGLPACSVTLGAGTWREDWTEILRPFRVAVCFDNNEAAPARGVVRRLRAEGVKARRLDLGRLGLARSKGDLSDYLNGGGDPIAIRRAALGSTR